jgi:ubiquinone/menaquinone biosynthesis C-methylase UbiE
MSKTIPVSDEIKPYNTFNVNYEVNDLFTFHSSKELDKYDFNKLKNTNMEHFTSFIEQVSTRIYNSQGHQESDKNYKLSYFSQIVTQIINQIINYKHKKNIFQHNMKHFLYVLTLIEHGHKFLKQIKDILTFDKETFKTEILHMSSSKGGFPAFLFWMNFFNIDILKDDFNYIIINSIKNSDDRLYKWILDKIKENKSMLLHKNSVVEQMLNNLLTAGTPTKHKLKKLRILSENCNLNPYFNEMISYSAGSYFSIIKELFKHYYHKPLTFHEIITINSNSYIDIPSDDDYKMIYIKLKTEKEQFYFLFTTMVHHLTDFGSDYNINKFSINTKELLQENIEILTLISNTINNIGWSNELDSINSLEKLFNYEINGKKSLGEAIKVLCKYDFFKYCFHFNSTNDILGYFAGNMEFLLPLCKFIPIRTHNLNAIKINRVLHFLRIVAKKKTKAKMLGYQLKFFPVMDELMNFKPTNKPILAKGSYNWQINKQRFTNVPPRHLLPQEFSIYNNFLIREKADGILLNNLSTNIYPVCNDLIHNHVKAEYIEELDLYFVFDIEKPNTTIVDRYNEIRSMHSYTNKTTLQTVNSVNELINLIEKERIIFNKFLEETKDHQIRWYPKVSYLVNNCSKEFKSQIIQDMIVNSESRLSKFINEEAKYKCDGLILSPINGYAMRDIKIKPKSMMTIDLLFDGTNWIDKEKNKYTSTVTSTTKPKQGKIYRCYPVETDKYQAREIRFDKKYPNSSDIINIIQTTYKYDWTKSENTLAPYYQVTNVKLESEYIRELEKQNSIFSEQIEKLSPEVNKTWLDLGCGKGKLINQIKKYNPKKYVGMDVDANVLLRNINQIDDYDWIKLSQCDLRENWFENSKWYNIKNMNFDYIVLNYSIMHLFDSEHFWKCLKAVTKKDTKILFNIVSDKVKTQEFKLKDAYMQYQDGNIKYCFPWSQKTEITERFIERKQVEEMIRKNGFLIDTITNPTDIPCTQDTLNSTSGCLSTYYDWYKIVIGS